MVDVRERTQVEAAVARAVAAFGRLDILVNNAGIMDRAPFLEMTDELWHRVIGINLYGTFLFAQVAARQMVRQGERRPHRQHGVELRHLRWARPRGLRRQQGRHHQPHADAWRSSWPSMASWSTPSRPAPPRRAPEQPREAVGQRARAHAAAALRDGPRRSPRWLPSSRPDEASFTTGHVYAADGGFTITGIMDG